MSEGDRKLTAHLLSHHTVHYNTTILYKIFQKIDERYVGAVGVVFSHLGGAFLGSFFNVLLVLSCNLTCIFD